MEQHILHTILHNMSKCKTQQMKKILDMVPNRLKLFCNDFVITKETVALFEWYKGQTKEI
jgi:hypothetical protein